MRRKSIRRDRYIGGTASARVRGPSFFGVAVFILRETGNTWICMENYGMDAVPLSL